jgi:hypothetical protein
VGLPMMLMKVKEKVVMAVEEEEEEELMPSEGSWRWPGGRAPALGCAGQPDASPALERRPSTRPDLALSGIRRPYFGQHAEAPTTSVAEVEERASAVLKAVESGDEAVRLPPASRPRPPT